MDFTDFGLCGPLLRAVRERGHVVPTPVQVRAIPAILSGRDVMQIARAGTGKTAAYALPLLQRLMGARRDTARPVRAMILVANRRLALHVAGAVQSYGAYLPFRCTASYRGLGPSRPYRADPSPVDIVVATPADILDAGCRGRNDLTEIEVLVLDDVGELFDRNSPHDVRRVFSCLSAQRQNVFLSATPSDHPEAASGWQGREPCFFDSVRQARHQG